MRNVPLKPGKPLQRRASLVSTARLERRTPLPQVSKKRAAQIRRRKAVIAATWPERPLCSVPLCCNWADDIHEPLTRARGGVIDQAQNMAPLCRPCHDVITFTPESELEWAYSAGLLRHSWPGGEAA
jgi:hypothetical protein